MANLKLKSGRGVSCLLTTSYISLRRNEKVNVGSSPKIPSVMHIYVILPHGRDRDDLILAILVLESALNVP